MTYRINKADGTFLADVLDNRVDTITTSINLIGANVSYGEFVNENFVKLLENFASSSQPDRPLVGQLWYSTETGKVQVYNGEKFIDSAGPIVQPTLPTDLLQGDIWIDNLEDQLRFYDGADLTLAGPIYQKTQKLSGFTVDTILDKTGKTRIIVKLWLAGTLLGIFSKDPVAFEPEEPIDQFSGNISCGFNPSTLENFKFRVPFLNAESLIDNKGRPRFISEFMQTRENTATVGTVTISNSTPLEFTRSNASILSSNTNFTIFSPDVPIKFTVTNSAAFELDLLTLTPGDPIEVGEDIYRIGESNGYLFQDLSLNVVGNFEVDEDLYVLGSLRQVPYAPDTYLPLEFAISKNLIKFNAGETGIGLPQNATAGIIGYRPLGDVSLLWDETRNGWYLVASGTTDERVVTLGDFSTAALSSSFNDVIDVPENISNAASWVQSSSPNRIYYDEGRVSIMQVPNSYDMSVNGIAVFNSVVSDTYKIPIDPATGSAKIDFDKGNNFKVVIKATKILVVDTLDICFDPLPSGPPSPSAVPTPLVPIYTIGLKNEGIEPLTITQFITYYVSFQVYPIYIINGNYYGPDGNSYWTGTPSVIPEIKINPGETFYYQVYWYSTAGPSFFYNNFITYLSDADNGFPKTSVGLNTCPPPTPVPDFNIVDIPIDLEIENIPVGCNLDPDSPSLYFTLTIYNGGLLTYPLRWPPGTSWTTGEYPQLTENGYDIFTCVSTDCGETWLCSVVSEGVEYEPVVFDILTDLTKDRYGLYTVEEGTTFTIIVNYTGVPPGIEIFYTIEGVINQDDISAPVQGSFISDETRTWNILITANVDLDDDEGFEIGTFKVIYEGNISNTFDFFIKDPNTKLTLDLSCSIFPDIIPRPEDNYALSELGPFSTALLLADTGFIKFTVNGAGSGALGNRSTGPGLMYDPWGTYRYGVDDYITPGTPWEGFAVEINRSFTLFGSNLEAPYPAKMWNISSGNAIHFVALLGTPETGFLVVQYRTLLGDTVIRIKATYVNTTNQTKDIRMMRGIDPDVDVNLYNEYDTLNSRGYGNIPATDLVLSLGQQTLKPLSMYCPGDGYTHNTAVIAAWPTYDIDAILAGTEDSGVADHAICVAWDFGTVSPGSYVSACCYYICAPDLQGTVDIINGDAPSTYFIQSEIANPIEGQTVVFEVTTSGVPDGTVLYWTTYSAGINLGEIVCVGVIDESSAGATQIRNDWLAFRAAWPNRKFYLLQPGGPTQGSLEEPQEFRDDPLAFGPIAVNRDNGQLTLASDWFTICDLNNVPAGSVVALSVDDSGSMTRSTVAGSLALLATKCDEFGVAYVERSMGSAERWSVTFNDTILPSGGTPVSEADFSDNTLSGSVVIFDGKGYIDRPIALDSVSDSFENFQLELRTESISGTIVAISNVVIIR
jgi:hypothetical protein